MAGPPAGARRIGAFSIGFCGFRDSFIAMNRQAIIAKLRENEAALRGRGVAHAALFGSHARGDNRPDSDIDILIDIAPDAPVGLWEYVGITQYLEDLFSSRVDVADHSHLNPRVRPSAEREAVYAF
jgi:predicted nucleotidyltransferase